MSCADGRHPTVRVLRGSWRCAVCGEPAEVRFPAQKPTSPEVRIPVHCPGYPTCTLDVGHAHYADASAGGPR